MELLNMYTSVFLTLSPPCKPNAQDLFSHHQKEFDACIHLILQKYPPGHETVTATTLIGLEHPRWWLTEPCQFDLERLFLPDLFHHYCTGSRCRSDHEIFELAMLGGPFSSPQEAQWMLQFFSDTSRSKSYALSGKRYAAASLAILTNICREKFYKAVLSKALECVRLFYPLVAPCTDKAPFSDVDRPISEDCQILNLGCAYLPQLLLRSSATSELITFLRGRHFERAYVNYNDNYYSLERATVHNSKMEELVSTVVKAIQNYLEVCDFFST